MHVYIYMNIDEKELFLATHRQMFCWMDEWYGLSIEQVCIYIYICIYIYAYIHKCDEWYGLSIEQVCVCVYIYIYI